MSDKEFWHSFKTLAAIFVSSQKYDMVLAADETIWDVAMLGEIVNESKLGRAMFLDKLRVLSARSLANYVHTGFQAFGQANVILESWSRRVKDDAVNAVEQLRNDTRGETPKANQ